MSPFHDEFDVDRRPEDVWAYVADPSRLPEWQRSAVSAERLDTEPLGIGSRVRVVRYVGRREVPMTMEFTQYDPPRAWAMRGIDGPVRGRFHGEITPIDDGTRSHVTLDLDFEPHGIGRVLVPLVVRAQVRKEMPQNERLLKERLEHSAA
ncbi:MULTISPECIES: SRPBCC family protein [unclassified Streptomyces]|uniref:SRPBCC family protein n=1 Tax=unclassified Streptomyces TaxID=2593676 RepID=UPI003D74A233